MSAPLVITIPHTAGQTRLSRAANGSSLKAAAFAGLLLAACKRAYQDLEEAVKAILDEALTIAKCSHSFSP